MSSPLENSAPEVFTPLPSRIVTKSDLDPACRDPFDAREIFDLIRDINDPEHPLTLEELNVVELNKVKVDDDDNQVCLKIYSHVNLQGCEILNGNIFTLRTVELA